VGVIFLDQDDEITTAIARLRASEDIRVAFVLPTGSRLGTSRINFRLLAREAQELPRQASIVTTEAGVRAIAVSAGLPAYASVAEYESAADAAASAGAAAGAATSAGAVAMATTAATTPDTPATPADATLDAGAPALGAAAVAAVASSAMPGIDPGPAIAPPVAATAKRSRSKRKAVEEPVEPAVDELAAAGAVTTSDAGTTAVSAAAEAAATATPDDAGSDDPTMVIDAAALGGAAAASNADTSAEAIDVGAADAAAASAFGAEAASVPPPPRGPSPRSSAALPVVGGPVRSTGILGGRGAMVGALAVIAAVGVLAVALAILVLPQATITVSPPLETVGPVSRTLIADPTAIEVDETNGIIPAELVKIPVSAQGDFTATGVRVIETKAKGTVTFSNFDTSGKRTIPAGSIVATDSDVRFRTLASARLAKAKIIGGTTIVPGTDSVRVEAVKAGTAGNVPANAIHNVPAGQDPILLKVTNGAATNGGEKSESTRISQEDVDLAAAELTKQLERQMSDALADPATTPAGSTLIEETAALGKVKAEPSLDGLVGRNVRTFSLKQSATGQVIAVDTGVLEPLAAAALTATVPKGTVLFPESIHTTVGTPKVDGGVVSFDIGASGQAWRPLDEATLLAEARGRSVVEAEDALSKYGEVTVDVWPFYVATVPDGDRTTLMVVPPTPSGQ
jgi:hypothetical protein